jgi:hypothetical protein
MQITLGPSDFAEAVSDKQLQEQLSNQPIILGGEEERVRAVYDALPRALARRLRQILPEGFDITEIEMKVTFSGNPLGVGIAGDALVRFGPSRGLTST